MRLINVGNKLKKGRNGKKNGALPYYEREEKNIKITFGMVMFLLP